MVDSFQTSIAWSHRGPRPRAGLRPSTGGAQEPPSNRGAGPDLLEDAMRARNSSDDQINAMCGDPGFAREFVERFVEIGVDELILVMQIGTVPHELVLESIRTFGEKVLPHFV